MGVRGADTIYGLRASGEKRALVGRDVQGNRRRDLREHAVSARAPMATIGRYCERRAIYIFESASVDDRASTRRLLLRRNADLARSRRADQTEERRQAFA